MLYRASWPTQAVKHRNGQWGAFGGHNRSEGPLLSPFGDAVHEVYLNNLNRALGQDAVTEGLNIEPQQAKDLQLRSLFLSQINGTLHNPVKHVLSIP